MLATHFVYYVKTEGECLPSDRNLGSLLMLTSNRWPENIDFRDPREKVILLKVCHSGQER